MKLNLEPGTAGLGNPALIEAIVEDMDGGAITFERFMELAQYHPEHGYYRKPGRIGRDGDFLTSPAIHPMFGWAVAGWCHWAWSAMGKPAPFLIFEPGAGDGSLATSILDWAGGRDRTFGDAIRYVALDPTGPTARDRRIEWSGSPPHGEHGVVLSNELFDALPFRLFDATGRGPVEVMVRWNGQGFEEVGGPIATIDGAPEVGRFEVNTRAYPTMEAMCAVVDRGAVLTFDYGYPRDELWAPWRTKGTMLCFYRHTAHENPYIHVGDQDITAHVDFTELEAAMTASGYDTHGPVRQSEFLFALGAHDLVEAARDNAAEYFVRKRSLTQLSDGAGLGRIRVLAGLRGLDVEGVPGFDEERV